MKIPRPLRGQPLESTWPALLGEHFPLADIWQRARPRGCILDVQAELRNFTESLDRFDVVVVQTGIVDAAPRPYPFLVYKLIEILVSYERMRQFERFAHDRLLWAYGRPWLSSAEFARRAAEIVRTVAQSARTPLIFVPIAPPTKAIARQLPGIDRNVLGYNRALFELGAAMPASAHLRTVNPFAGQDLQTLTIEDGHHLSREGHRLVAAAVAAALAELIPSLVKAGGAQA